MYFVQIGVLVGLIATSVQSIGLTLQRKSHILEDEKALQHTRAQRPPYRRRRWQVSSFSTPSTYVYHFQ